VAAGSGRAPKEVSELVKRFGQMRDVMGALGGKGGGLLSRIPGLGRFAGAGAGAGGLSGLDPAALLGGGPPGAGGPRRTERAGRDRDREKRKRKQAKKDRRKGRRK
jgi:signal recognition particle subunit SRP54